MADKHIQQLNKSQKEHILQFNTLRKEGYEADVWFIPSDQPNVLIPAHKQFLCYTKAGTVRFFRDMFTDLEASSKIKQIPVEMTTDQLEAFLEFVYTFGHLPDHKLVQHSLALYKAAHKYEIPSLKGLCRDKLIESMDSFDVFELADIPKKN